MGGIAQISGVALVPGVSRNRRLYTPELIARAAKRMQERLADPNGLPIVMRTHHEAGDDSAKIVGRVTAVEVDDTKSLRYKAQLYDTTSARDIANLVTPESPALRSVSIHGYWMGDTRQVQTENGPATTADDLEIDAIDFTATPGVDGALIDSSSNKATESGGVLRTPLSESMEASVSLIEEAQSWSIQRGVQYELDSPVEMTHKGEHVLSREGLTVLREAKYSADDMKALLAKGHAMKNASGEPSYPIADVSDLKKAIKAVGRGKSDHDAIRKHIIKRAKALGQSALIPDNWNSDGSMKESHIRTSKITEYFPGGDEVAAFCIDAYAGPLSVTLRGCVPPDQLRGAAIAAAQAAMDAINALDPDNDADIDAGMETAPAPENEAAETVGQFDALLNQIREMRNGSPSLNDYRKGLGLPTVDPKVDEALRSGEMLGLLRELIRQELPATAESGAVSKDDDMESMSGDHAHTHGMAEDSNHTHGHVHTHETAGGGSYDHSHGHTHFHLSGSDEAHSHGHDHDHATAPGDTYESHTEEESAVSETTQAAEAAPTRVLTDADMTALGETIGSALAEALRAIAEAKEPKHAATQETAETAETVATESITKVDESEALKESLAKMRRELRDELRAEFLKENGLPARRGYRLTENESEEEGPTDADLYADRVDILLGSFAKPATPGA